MVSRCLAVTSSTLHDPGRVAGAGRGDGVVVGARGGAAERHDGRARQDRLGDVIAGSILLGLAFEDALQLLWNDKVRMSLHAVDVDAAVEVVAFVLDDPGEEVLGIDGVGLALPVEGLEPDPAEARDLAAQVGNREAALPADLDRLVEGSDTWD